MGTPVPFGSVLKSLFLCDLRNFCHHSSEKGGQERLEQQTFTGEERVKTDSYHAVWVWVCANTYNRALHVPVVGRKGGKGCADIIFSLISLLSGLWRGACVSK